MSKAKKNFIAAIIWVVVGVMLVVSGGIMVTMAKQLTRIFGVIVLCCGSAIIGLGVYLVITKYKIYKKEKAR